MGWNSSGTVFDESLPYNKVLRTPNPLNRRSKFPFYHWVALQAVEWIKSRAEINIAVVR